MTDEVESVTLPNGVEIMAYRKAHQETSYLEKQ